MTRCNKKRAVCLFSGGLDSTTVLYYAMKAGYEVHALTIDYGQRHAREIAAARRIARRLKVEHRVIKMALPWGGSALTARSIAVPTGRSSAAMHASIPVTYVPSRNIVFLSLACSWAEVLGASAVFIGVNQRDYSGYPDCRGSFITAFQQAVRRGTRAGVEGRSIAIKTPLINMTKHGIIRQALTLGVPVHETWSCYQGGKKPCGVCDACILRREGFERVIHGS